MRHPWNHHLPNNMRVILSWKGTVASKKTISIENRCLSEDFKNRTSRWLRIQLRDSCFKQLLMLKDMKCPIFSAKFNWTLGAFFALSSHSSTKRNKKHKRKSWTRSGWNWSKVLHIFLKHSTLRRKKNRTTEPSTGPFPSQKTSHHTKIPKYIQVHLCSLTKY